jgi:hypothetical protein
LLLREAYRKGGKSRKRTLCNLLSWPVVVVEGLRSVLRGGAVVFAAEVALPNGAGRCDRAVYRHAWPPPISG